MNSAANHLTDSQSGRDLSRTARLLVWMAITPPGRQQKLYWASLRDSIPCMAWANQTSRVRLVQGRGASKRIQVNIKTAWYVRTWKSVRSREPLAAVHTRVPLVGSEVNFIDSDESTDASSAGVGHLPKRASMVGPAGLGVGDGFVTAVGLGLCEAAPWLGWLHDTASRSASTAALMHNSTGAAGKRYDRTPIYLVCACGSRHEILRDTASDAGQLPPPPPGRTWCNRLGVWGVADDR